MDLVYSKLQPAIAGGAGARGSHHKAGSDADALSAVADAVPASWRGAIAEWSRAPPIYAVLGVSAAISLVCAVVSTTHIALATFTGVLLSLLALLYLRRVGS